MALRLVKQGNGLPVTSLWTTKSEVHETLEANIIRRKTESYGRLIVEKRTPFLPAKGTTA